MAEELITIEANARTQSGKQAAKKLRKAGLIPGNLMEKGKSTMIELSPKWLGRAYQSGKTFNLVFEGATKLVKIHEVCIDPIKREPLHVDLVYA